MHTEQAAYIYNINTIPICYSKVQKRGNSMLSGIRKQRDILLSLNDEIEEELDNLKSVYEQIKESEKTRDECNEMIKNYNLEMPRVRKDLK